MPNNQPVTKPDSEPSKASAKQPSSPRRNPDHRLSREELSRHEREVRATRMIFAGMGALFVVIVSILGFGWWREYVARASDPVATVAGKTITLDSYARMLDFRRKSVEQQMQYMQAQLQSLGSGSGDQSLTDLFRQQIQQLQFQIVLLPDQTLNEMIDEQLVRQEAARRGIMVSAQDIDNEIKSIANGQVSPATEPTPPASPSGADQATPGAEATPAPGTAATPAPTTDTGQSTPPTPAPTVDVQSWVKNYVSVAGITEADLRSMVEYQLLYQKLSDAMGAEVPTSAEQVHARHILVATEDKAKQIEDQLKNGAKFEDLAKADSTDTGTKDKGGDLGWFPRGQMVPEFDNVAFKLQPGQISDPVKTTYGYHIIQVLEKDPNRPLDPQALEQEKAQALPNWLSKVDTADSVKRSLSDADKQWVYKRIKWSPPA